VKRHGVRSTLSTWKTRLVAPVDVPGLREVEA
jgi:hypothetical protein